MHMKKHIRRLCMYLLYKCFPWRDTYTYIYNHNNPTVSRGCVENLIWHYSGGSYNPNAAKFRHGMHTGITSGFMIRENYCSLKSTFGNYIKDQHFADLVSFLPEIPPRNNIWNIFHTCEHTTMLETDTIKTGCTINLTDSACCRFVVMVRSLL